MPNKPSIKVLAQLAYYNKHKNEYYEILQNHTF